MAELKDISREELYKIGKESPVSLLLTLMPTNNIGFIASGSSEDIAQILYEAAKSDPGIEDILKAVGSRLAMEFFASKFGMPIEKLQEQMLKSTTNIDPDKPLFFGEGGQA